jgi:hypothetical protein
MRNTNNSSVGLKPVLKGHGFSRAAKPAILIGALAPEGIEIHMRLAGANR